MAYLLSLFAFLSMFDPAIALQIDRMGHDSYLVREEAYNSLYDMDERAVKLLIVASKCHRDAEVRGRARNLLEFQMDKLNPKQCSMPWLECLPAAFPHRAAVIERYMNEHGFAGTGWEWAGNEAHHMRDATHHLMRELFLKGHSRAQIADILDIMSDNERQWRNHGGRWINPPEFKR